MPRTEAVARRTYGGRSAADRKAERRERLLEAGLHLFGNEGYATSSIEKLCTHAGVSTRNFYEEFNSREDLLIALHARANERSFRAVLAAFADNADAGLAERFELAVRTFIHTMASDARLARIAYVEMIGVSNSVEKHRMAWRARWWDMMVAEADRAVLRGEAQARDFRLPALAVIASVNELVHHYSLNRGRITLDEVIAEVVRFAVAAVTAP
ncbi:TetR/AcrR family transcriptional regulator [Actinophytocola oryzae]|uniref:TetR family transcriptional regulator n=1 Tax=Actinophytocola oryzae TaxID=502181 RepID=A0A4R7VRA6_9PSEU|nr:TetR/AcrR family transcriptional regulator [Actinophytocola oryzae]TDV52320.1 TetR family transcriptional regulator [Actinophytocola oryzae]